MKLKHLLVLPFLLAGLSMNAQDKGKKVKTAAGKEKTAHAKANPNAADKKENSVDKSDNKSDRAREVAARNAEKHRDHVDDRMKGPKGEKIYIGDKGGRYYLNSAGKKVYVPFKRHNKKKD